MKIALFLRIIKKGRLEKECFMDSEKNDESKVKEATCFFQEPRNV